jgi:hypothetical protein
LPVLLLTAAIQSSSNEDPLSLAYLLFLFLEVISFVFAQPQHVQAPLSQLLLSKIELINLSSIESFIAKVYQEASHVHDLTK